jgi:hypothetical protein
MPKWLFSIYVDSKPDSKVDSQQKILVDFYGCLSGSLSLKRMAGSEENTRHKGENRLIWSGFSQRLKQNTLFPRVRSDSRPDSNITGFLEPVLLIHFFGSSRTWKQWWRSIGLRRGWRFLAKDRE